MRFIKIAALLTLASTPGLMFGQFDFHVAGRDVQFHSFGSQGFAYSNANNYLTMSTSQGSAAFTDGGLNASVMITDRLRVGAQFYIRNIGDLGNFHPELDWAVVDYRFSDWFGVRAGKVKTALGLYNDTQDLEFLHTWAILPQSAYPLDLRASTIAHTGGDVYGAIPMRKLGGLAYTFYAGSRPDDSQGGYYLGLAANRLTTKYTNANFIGGDLRWNTPVKGLLLGYSYLNGAVGAKASTLVAPSLSWTVDITGYDRMSVLYGQFKRDRVTLDGEYRREVIAGRQDVGPLPSGRFSMDSRSWWASAAYRVNRRLELGTYHSRFYPNWAASYKGSPSNHMFDQVVTARVDLNTHWDVKVEGHFIDGYGSPSSFRGFYPQQNPGGLMPNTNMLVLRTGVNF